MQTLPLTLLCPLDGLPLHTDNHVARCSSGHAFDWAKEGYLNLLPVHAKQSKDPGDSPLMVQARRRFLSTGYYHFFMDALCTHIPHEAHHILDAGCGEGSYIQRFCHTLHHADQHFYGVDISKHAVKAAAKLYPHATWLVASNRQLPFPSHSLDVVICAFGFPVWHEFKRVLKENGRVIMLDPAPNHLIQLRQSLYQNVVIKESDFLCPDDFTLQHSETIQTHISVTQADHIADLIAMTPHQHRATQQAITHICQTGCPHLTLEATIRILCA
jgi:23S rRNA (guanine745-N1)-methyltransferase